MNADQACKEIAKLFIGANIIDFIGGGEEGVRCMQIVSTLCAAGYLDIVNCIIVMKI